MYIIFNLKEVYLKFEKDIQNRSKKDSLLSFDEISRIAENYGINGNGITEAIRFLNDLGSLQYFEINGLKDKVVINPQVKFKFDLLCSCIYAYLI